MRVMFDAIALLWAVQETDFGVRVPPGAPTPREPNVIVVRPKQNLVQSKRSNSFSCVVSYVTDGDTFRCSNGTRIRLSSIDTPEMPGSCRQGRTCAPGNPYAAKAALERLVRGRTVQCQPVGMSYGRVAAWCSVGGVDLSCAMVRGGYAVRLPKLDRERRLCR